MDLKGMIAGLSACTCAFLCISDELSSISANKTHFTHYEKNIKEYEQNSYLSLCDYLINESKVIFFKIAAHGLKAELKDEYSSFLQSLYRVANIAYKRFNNNKIPFKEKNESVYYSVIALISIINAALDDNYMKAAGGFNYQTLIDVDIIAEGKIQAELFNFYNNLGA